MTLFTRVFRGVKVTAKLWDLYLLDGVTVLFQCAIALLRILSEQSLIWGEFEDILMSLQNVGNFIIQRVNGSEEKMEALLTKYMGEVSFPRWVKEEIPLLESEFFKQGLLD